MIYLIYLACHLNLDLQYIKTKLIKCEENYFSVVNVLFISVFDHFRKKKAIDLPSVESIISIFTENFVSFSVSIGHFLNKLTINLSILSVNCPLLLTTDEFSFVQITRLPYSTCSAVTDPSTSRSFVNRRCTLITLSTQAGEIFACSSVIVICAVKNQMIAQLVLHLRLLLVERLYTVYTQSATRQNYLYRHWYYYMFLYLELSE